MSFLDSLKSLFGQGPKVSYAELHRAGAIILDVRSRGEYASGHIKGSINISVDSLAQQLPRLNDKSKVIITCCASGMRSASAKRLLQRNGYQNVYNGGGWLSLRGKLNK